MEKDNTIYLRNMVDKAREAVAFCGDKTLEDFLADSMLQSAVVMKLIVVGEEARKVSEQVIKEIDLPWRMIVGFRNMAVHEYFDLDLEQVWVTVREDLPKLIEAIDVYLKAKRE
ncbi:MAG: DUF86 domain-containing protein [Candidatus Pacebacteria bacterium]|nr:DUF86 domain-containing protein [Candidatus Paceibacterota bacterium]